MPFRNFLVEDDLYRAFMTGALAAGLLASMRPHAAMSLAMGLAWLVIGACVLAIRYERGLGLPHLIAALLFGGTLSAALVDQFAGPLFS